MPRSCGSGSCSPSRRSAGAVGAFVAFVVARVLLPLLLGLPLGAFLLVLCHGALVPAASRGQSSDGVAAPPWTLRRPRRRSSKRAYDVCARVWRNWQTRRV